MIKIVVTLSKELDETWGSEEDFEDLTDAQIIELLKGDLYEFEDGGAWSVERIREETTK